MTFHWFHIVPLIVKYGASSSCCHTEVTTQGPVQFGCGYVIFTRLLLYCHGLAWLNKWCGFAAVLYLNCIKVKSDKQFCVMGLHSVRIQSCFRGLLRIYEEPVSMVSIGSFLCSESAEASRVLNLTVAFHRCLEAPNHKHWWKEEELCNRNSAFGDDCLQLPGYLLYPSLFHKVQIN